MCEPVYEEFEGWKDTDISRVKRFSPSFGGRSTFQNRRTN